MKVTLVMHEDFSRDSKKEFYTLSKHYSIYRGRDGINKFIDVEIPERFNPGVNLEGDNAYVTIDIWNSACSQGFMLDEVLGCDSFGNPAIVWTDPEYGFKRTVSLEYEPKYYVLE